MKFRIGPNVYAVHLCPGPLLSNGEPIAATTFRGEVLIDGTLEPEERLWAVLDQLYRVHLAHYGVLTRSGVPSFAADMFRQLEAMGGEAALRALAPACSTAV